jgi:AraC family transcriptional regulator
MLSPKGMGDLRVTDAVFAAETVMDWHSHDTPIFAVFLEGSMDVDFRGRGRLGCTRSAVQVHPAGEPHRQVYGRKGARILVVEPDVDDEWIKRGGFGFLSGIHNFADDRILALACRAKAELKAPDEVTPLALQALASEMIVLGARRSPIEGEWEAPAWLARATELVRASFLERLRLSDIAGEVGVHPGHFARVFRRHHHESLGTYVRRLRLDWAARRLAESGESLSEIALGAGFADQSHLTRAFKQYLGLTPARYRHLKRV